MSYYVFQVSDQSKYGKQRSAREVFDFLVKERSSWGFGYKTPNRKAIQIGDKVLFYLTGTANQIFVGDAVIKATPYEDKSGESKAWFLDPETLRIGLENVNVWNEPKPRKDFQGIEWRPQQGGSSKISQKDYEIVIGLLEDKITISDEEVSENEFFLEKYLEEFIVDNWDHIDFGQKLTIFEDKDGNKGQQYYTQEVGYIDILALDANNDFLVIELKKGRKNDEVVGQVLRYISWVRKNLCKKNQNVKGLIIVGKKDSKLEYALEEIKDKVKVKLYNVKFKLEEY